MEVHIKVDGNIVTDAASRKENLSTITSGNIYKVNVDKHPMAGDHYNVLTKETIFDSPARVEKEQIRVRRENALKTAKSKLESLNLTKDEIAVILGDL